MAIPKTRGWLPPSLLGATLIWGSSFRNPQVHAQLGPHALGAGVPLHRRGAAHGAHRLEGTAQLASARIPHARAWLGAALFTAYTLQTFGLEYTTPGKNAFLTATYCVIVPFMWWFFTKKRPDRYNIAAALVCICGMALCRWTAA